MRVGLIGCSAGKLPVRAPAKLLYTGPLFELSRAWIAARTELDSWAILSARHGLVLPDQEIEPYDLSLSSMSADERARWAANTRAQIVDRWGAGTIFMIVAGEYYALSCPEPDDVFDQRQSMDGGSVAPAHIGIGVLKKYLNEMKSYAT